MKQHNSYESQVMELELSQESGMFSEVKLVNDQVVIEEKGSYKVGALVSKHEAWFFDLKTKPLKK